MREFLNRKTFAVRQSDENGNIAFGSDHADWIEIPEGAELCFEFRWDNGTHCIEFFKDNCWSFYSEARQDWLPSGSNPKYKKEANLIWERKQPDAAASPNEIAKKEYLLPTDRGYELCLCEEGMTIHESWIEIPKGADTLAGSINSDEYRYFFDHKNKKLIGCGPSLSRYPDWAPMKDSANDWLDELDDDSLGILWQHKLPAVASPNDIARTAEVHREHNLSNELNDLCAEFGCPPGMDRFA